MSAPARLRGENQFQAGMESAYQIHIKSLASCSGHTQSVRAFLPTRLETGVNVPVLHTEHYYALQ